MCLQTRITFVQLLKAEVGTPLADLPKLFEAEELKKLSVIETESIRRLK